MIINELKKNKMFRYKGQIDFYLHEQGTADLNPFVRHSLLKSPKELHTKIILKDFKSYLSGEKSEDLFNDPFFHALRMGQHVLLVENLGEIWYNQGQIFSLSKA